MLLPAKMKICVILHQTKETVWHHIYFHHSAKAFPTWSLSCQIVHHGCCPSQSSKIVLNSIHKFGSRRVSLPTSLAIYKFTSLNYQFADICEVAKSSLAERTNSSNHNSQNGQNCRVLPNTAWHISPFLTLRGMFRFHLWCFVG